MMSFMGLDGITSSLRFKDVTNIGKRLWHSLSIGQIASVQWRKDGRSWRLQMCFRHLLCVRIEIDKLQCVNCLVIIHCLSVSCMKVNHSPRVLVIWFSLPLTSKQWIITQQFTARAVYFLNIIISLINGITLLIKRISSFINGITFLTNGITLFMKELLHLSKELHFWSMELYFWSMKSHCWSGSSVQILTVNYTERNQTFPTKCLMTKYIHATWMTISIL